VVAKDITGAALTTPHRGFFQLYQTYDYNTWADFLNDSLQANLDSLQRFTKQQTDSLQAVLDSIQNQDNWVAKEATVQAHFDTLKYVGPRGLGIYLDSAAGNTNTVLGTDGTAKNPVSTLVAARTLADALGYNRYYLINRSTFLGATVDLGVTHLAWEFIGIGHLNKIGFGGQQLTGSYFENLDVEGDLHTSGGHVMFERCVFGFVSSNFAGHAYESIFTDTIVMKVGRDLYFVDCASSVAGNMTPTIDLSGGSSIVQLRGYSGGIRLMNGSSNDTVSVETDGQVIISANNTSVVVTVRGMASITDSGTTTALTQDAVWNRTYVTSVEAGLFADTSWLKDTTGFTAGGTFGYAATHGAAASISAADIVAIADTILHRDSSDVNDGAATSFGTLLMKPAYVQGAASGLDTIDIKTMMYNNPKIASGRMTMFRGTVAGTTPAASGFVVTGDGSVAAGAFDVTEADDYYNDLRMIFYSGNLRGRSSPIVDWIGATDSVVVEFFGTATIGDSFVVVANEFPDLWKWSGSVVEETQNINGQNLIETNAQAFSRDNVAADNAEIWFDGTGYDNANSTIGTATTVTGGATSANQTLIIDSLQAALDSLQRFTEQQTDSLQAVLDSLQLAAITNLKEAFDGDGTGSAMELTRLRIIAASNDTALIARGGGSGYGAYISGGNVAGTGMRIEALAGNNDGLRIAGFGVGSGIASIGGNTAGKGIYGLGGTDGPGIQAHGLGTGDGLYALSSVSGAGFRLDGGQTSGNALELNVISGDLIQDSAITVGTIKSGALDSSALAQNYLYESWAYDDSTAPNLENELTKWMVNNLAGGGGGGDPSGGWIDSIKGATPSSGEFHMGIFVVDTQGVGAGGDPDTVSRVSISTQDASGNTRDVLQTDANGFTFFKPSSGDWTLVAERFGYTWIDTTFTVSANDTLSIKGYNFTTVSDPASADLSRVHGYLRTIEDKKIDGATVIATFNTGTNQADTSGTAVIITDVVASTASDSTGYFFLDLRRTSTYADTTRGFYDIRGYRGEIMIFEIIRLPVPASGNLNLGDTLGLRQ
jgi:hypothetical protein